MSPLYYLSSTYECRGGTVSIAYCDLIWHRSCTTMLLINVIIGGDQHQVITGKGMM
jgi:hypothetical protein